MKLEQVLAEVNYEVLQGSLDKEVADIAYDSRKVKKDVMFVAIEGTVVDGHKFIDSAVAQGAGVVVVEKRVEVADKDVTVVLVKNGRVALSLMSAAYFGYPAKKMITVGITGTKGKSTTETMVRDIIEKSGKTVGIIGTIGAFMKGKAIVTENTTPESYELQKLFAMMVENGCEYMVMEVSSQGIKMDRVAGIEFDYGVFTNISPDHIGPGEHKDFAEYLSCKAKLFEHCKVGIINKDDPHYEDIIKNATEQALQILRQMNESRESFRKIGLTFEEKAFYDILVSLRDQYNFEYGKDKEIGGMIVNDKCKILAKKVKEIIDTKSSFSDWLNNQNVRNQLKLDIKICLVKNGYPPQYSPEVFTKVMEQVENFEENSDMPMATTYTFPQSRTVSMVAEDIIPYGNKSED